MRYRQVMKNRFLLLFLSVNFVIACRKPGFTNNMESYTQVEYLIKKGKHAAEGNHFNILSTNEINCEVVFDSSALYLSANGANQEDVNKLTGFSDCNDNHQRNSARIGWSWNGRAVALYAYAYVNNERMIKTLSAVPLHKAVTCSVRAEGGQYYFSTGTVTDSIPRHCAGYSGSRYKLYPYFGGDETAPHDITIRIREW